MKAKSLEKGKYADGQGLWLWKSRKDAGSWVLRLVINGKRREMGLGRWPDVSIAEARELAQMARKQVRAGVDPIAERINRRSQPERMMVVEAIHSCFEARQAELKNDGMAGRWVSPLENHVIPKIGRRAIEDVNQHVLLEAIKPIWHSKPDAAEKSLSRMNLTLKHSAALGLDVDLQAVMKARALLGKQRHKREHIPALPYAEAPKFYRWLCSQNTLSALALRFKMLTVKRTSEIRFAEYGEIDGNVWKIPAERMKWPVEHRVPLVDEALEVVELTRKFSHPKLLFPSPRGNPMSDAAMSKFMREHGYTAKPHGLRATFRTWVEEQTDTPYGVKETALAHVVGSETERAYQRSDLLEKRYKLIKSWSAFLLST